MYGTGIWYAAVYLEVEEVHSLTIDVEVAK